MTHASFALTWIDVLIALIPLGALFFVYLGRRFTAAKVFSWFLHAAPGVAVLAITVIYLWRS